MIEVGAAKTMIERTEERFDIKPAYLAADTAYGSADTLNWIVNEMKIAPHIPVIDKSKREDRAKQSRLPRAAWKSTCGRATASITTWPKRSDRRGSRLLRLASLFSVGRIDVRSQD
jgi:hypothetical protein